MSQPRQSAPSGGKSSSHKSARRASDLGPKGRLTRQRLIEALLALLDEKPLSQISVLDIAERAETSPATFYLYFSNARAIALAVSGEISQSTPAMFRILEPEWTERNAHESALALVREYSAVWDRHRALLHARNQAADEGDMAFLNARSAALRPVITVMAGKIDGLTDEAAVPSDSAVALASVLVMMLERVGTTSPQKRYNRRASYEDIVNAAALLIASMLRIRPDGEVPGRLPSK